jgi:molybdopterin converting factor small subunit
MGDLLRILTDRYPALSKLSSLTIAVNGEYSQPHTIINSGDEVAIIPPVSGG